MMNRRDFLALAGAAAIAPSVAKAELFGDYREQEVFVPAITASSLLSGYYTITPSSGNAAIDLGNGANQRLVLTGTVVTILAPIYSGSAVSARMSLFLYLDQDATVRSDGPA
jgi:hypothetical protein